MILLTGGTGFIGSHIYDKLKDAGYNVRLFQGDITRLVDVERNLRGVEQVVHLAAFSYVPTSFDTPEAYFSTNTFGTLNILKCHKYYERLVHISTSHVYGEQRNLPITEDNCPNPIDPYSISKFAAEQLVRVYGLAYNTPYVILRPFNNFGPRQSKRFFVPKIINDALAGKKVELYGDSMRDFVYVEDTANAVLKILDSNLHSDIFNVCTGKAYWVSGVARIIYDILDVNNTITISPRNRPTDIPILEGSYKKIKNAIGWEPKISLTDGLRKTIEWYKNVERTNATN